MTRIGDTITEGKGKRVYATENPDEAVVYYKDEAIAFHGLKRGRIIGKGEINNRISEYLFTLLAREGVPNHFIRRIDDRSSLVKREDHPRCGEGAQHCGRKPCPPYGISRGDAS